MELYYGARGSYKLIYRYIFVLALLVILSIVCPYKLSKFKRHGIQIHRM